MSFNYALTRSDTGIYRRDNGIYYAAGTTDPIGVVDTDGSHIGYRFRRNTTNLFRNSEAASDPGQGTRTNISFVAGNLSSFPSDGYTVFAGGSTSRIYYNVASAPANNSQGTIAFICVKIAGGEPVVNSGTFTNDDIAARWGGGSVSVVPTEVYKEELITGVWFVRVKTTAAATATTSTGLLQSSGYTGTGVRATKIMAVDGHVDLTIFDYIKTTGVSLAQAITDIRNASMPEIDGISFVAKINISADSTTRELMYYGADDNNRLTVRYTNANVVQLLYVVGGVSIWNILQVGAVSGDVNIGITVRNGYHILVVNGTKIGEATNTFSAVGFTKMVIGRPIDTTTNPMYNCNLYETTISRNLTEAQLITATTL